MDKLKYSTLPLPRRKKNRKTSSSDDTSITSNTRKSNTLSTGKKNSLANSAGKAIRKMSRNSNKESHASDTPKKIRTEKDIEKLQACEKTVIAALGWFVDVVNKNILVMLPGSTTKVLQEIMELNNSLITSLSHEESKSIMETHSDVFKNLATLILWADKVVLRGCVVEEGNVNASEVSDAMRFSINALVNACQAKLKDKQLKLQADEPDPKAKRTSLPPQSMMEFPPPLPPKKGRESMFEFPTRPDTIINPDKTDFFNQSFSGSSLSVVSSKSSDQSHRSSTSSGSYISESKSTSKHSSSASSCVHIEDISKSTFQQYEMRSMEVISTKQESVDQFQYSLAQRPWSDIMPDVTIPEVEVTNPPVVPIKKKNYRERKLSNYENLNPDDAPALREKCTHLQEEEFIHHYSVESDTFSNITDEDDRRNSSGYGSVITQNNEEPPPLPPKMNHVDTYLDLLSGYNEEQFQINQTSYYSENRQVEYHGTTDEYSLHNRENFFQKSYNFTSRFPRSPRNSYGSSVETSSEGSYEGSVEGLPPALPVKLRVSPEHHPHRLRLNTNPEMPSMTKVELKKKSESAVIENGNTCSLRPSVEPTLDAITISSKGNSENEEPNLLDQLSISEYLIKSTAKDDPPIKGGPIDALIVYAADADRKELILSEVFLTTYRTVITAAELLHKLLYRYKKFRNHSDIKAKQANRNAFFLLLRIAGELIGQVEDNILEMLMELVFQLLCDGELMLAKILRDRVLSKIEYNQKALKQGHKLLSSLQISVSRATIFDFRTQDLAEQMTMMDSELFQKIEIPEVLLWAREQSETLSPNLTIFTRHFNKMSFWVRSVILQNSKAQERERLLIKFIKLMKHLKKLNNFNSYLAVLSALDSAPVRRLNWQKQTAEWLKEYSALIDSSCSFKCYRDVLAAAEPPCIPYLGLILQDMTFVHIGNPDMLPNSTNVNFIKCWQSFNILDSMRRFKQEQYDILEKDDKIIAFFNDFNDCLDEEAMWQLSKDIKPQGRSKAN